MNFYGNSILIDGFRLSDDFRESTEAEEYEAESPICKCCNDPLTFYEWRKGQEYCDKKCEDADKNRIEIID